MAPASRIAARLADLSHAQLVEIAAAGCEGSTQVKNRADALLAAHKPLAQWAVEGVLLSSDLVPHLLAPLQLEDGAAAAVCSRWAEGWKATSEGRRRLRKVAFDFPRDLLGERSLALTVIPGDDEQLIVRAGSTVRILGRDMSTSTSFELLTDSGQIAASEDFIYEIASYRELRREIYRELSRVIASYRELSRAIASYRELSRHDKTT
jgi:ketosteroid isomerase-like protein